jgi:hypothetical protein
MHTNVEIYPQFNGAPILTRQGVARNENNFRRRLAKSNLSRKLLMSYATHPEA